MKIGILGGGIAGLSAGYFLRRTCPDIQIHEASDTVGGLARSFKWHGFNCDLAPHRLFTNDEELLNEMLALVPMEKIRRCSRIRIQGRWIQDPVNAFEMVLKFLPFRSVRLVWTHLFRRKAGEANFEAMVLSKFGTALNEMFFKPYSEKLFGIPATEIFGRLGPAKLRVGGLKDMIRRNSKLYFKYFYYPKHDGYGAITERIHQEVKEFVQVRSKVTAVRPLVHKDGYRCEFQQNGKTVVEDFDLLVSSLPLSQFASLLGLDLGLRFRPARLTYFLLNKPQASPNHWFYFADGDHIINRVAEFKNFSSADVPADKTVICCEVTEVNRYSVDKVIDELQTAGILKRDEILDTKLIDIGHAYPIYDIKYETEIQRAADFFAQHPNIYQVGRHAQFAHKDIDEIFDAAKGIAAQIATRLQPELATESEAMAPALSAEPA